MISQQEIEFLKESNAIEKEYSDIALEDAIFAWGYAKNITKIGFKHLLEIHRLLMHRIDSDIAGKLRDHDIYIGGNRKIFISETLLKEQLQIFLKIVNSFNEDLKSKKQKQDWCKTEHIHFEHIHPFSDGNGRVGRILYNHHRLKLGLPIHVIHEGVEQKMYYLWFN